MLVEKIMDLEIIPVFETLALRAVLRGPDAPELPYSIAYLEIPPRQSSWPHKLKEENQKTEIYLIFAGKGIVHVGNESSEVEGLCAVPILPGQTQYIENTGEETLKLFCIVSPPWGLDDEVLGKRIA